MSDLTRRQFLDLAAKGTAMSLAASSLPLNVVQAAGADKYPFRNIDDAYAAAGFDPRAKGCMTFAVCGDSHVGYAKHEPLSFPSYIIPEINRMDPLPRFFLVDGDLITAGSLSFGNIPNEAQKKIAVAEFKAAKRDLAMLDPRVKLKITLGNHDTYPYEKDGALFRTVFSELPVYESFDMEGVHYMLLNGAQSGDIDPKQLAWMQKDVDAIPATQTVVAFVHQPSLHSVVNERGIRTAVKQVFAGHRGELWLVAGHVHRNHVSVFSLPETRIVQASVATCNPKVWGGPEKPGYWVYCIKDAGVHARIYCRKDAGCRIDAKPDMKKANPLGEPFDHTKGILWKVLVGEGDRRYLVSHKAADVVTWWGYTKELVYRFPLAELKIKPGRLAVLAALGARDPAKRGKVLVSADGVAWQELPLPKHAHNVYEMPLPASLQSVGSLFVRISAASPGVVVAGFALCE